jgi:hypothetical protein
VCAPLHCWLHLPFYVLLAFSRFGLFIVVLSSLFSFSFEMLMSHGCIIVGLHQLKSMFSQYMLSGFIFAPGWRVRVGLVDVFPQGVDGWCGRAAHLDLVVVLYCTAAKQTFEFPTW